MTSLFNFWNVHTLVVACLLVPASITFLGCEAKDGPTGRAGENTDEAGEEIRDKAGAAATD